MWALISNELFHPKSGHICLKDCLLLQALVGIFLSETDDRLHRLSVIAPAFRFAEDIFYVILDRLLLFFESLYPLDELTQLGGSNVLC